MYSVLYEFIVVYYLIIQDKIKERLSETGRRAARTEPTGNDGGSDDDSLFRTGR